MLIKKQFQLRKSSNDSELDNDSVEKEEERTAKHSKLWAAESTSRKITGLRIKNRESFLNLLEEALQKNYQRYVQTNTDCKSLREHDLLQCAVEQEYAVFTTTKVIIMYRKKMMTMIKDVQKNTDAWKLHPVLEACEPSQTLSQTCSILKQALTGEYNRNSPCEFKTASQLFINKEEKSVAIPSVQNKETTSKPAKIDRCKKRGFFMKRSPTKQKHLDSYFTVSDKSHALSLEKVEENSKTCSDDEDSIADEPEEILFGNRVETELASVRSSSGETKQETLEDEASSDSSLPSCTSISKGALKNSDNIVTETSESVTDLEENLFTPTGLHSSWYECNSLENVVSENSYSSSELPFPHSEVLPPDKSEIHSTFEANSSIKVHSKCMKYISSSEGKRRCDLQSEKDSVSKKGISQNKEKNERTVNDSISATASAISENSSETRSFIASKIDISCSRRSNEKNDKESKNRRTETEKHKKHRICQEMQSNSSCDDGKSKYEKLSDTSVLGTKRLFSSVDTDYELHKSGSNLHVKDIESSLMKKATEKNKTNLKKKLKDLFDTEEDYRNIEHKNKVAKIVAGSSSGSNICGKTFEKAVTSEGKQTEHQTLETDKRTHNSLGWKNSESFHKHSMIKKESHDKKQVADWMVKYLMPHYKMGKIISRDLFKLLAREMSHKFLEDCNDKAEADARQYVDHFFERCPLITTETDIKV